ncbi:MAG: ACT domain-containing protein [Oscillospiraceae bacterium]|jgi:hypothetical protein|nr:ACT domain-containing protein [Oscillospiraceae bacterium]
MFIKQISIFVENKPGRLADITEILAKNDVDIRALSIADTTDYGVLRLIVNEPEKAQAALKEAGVTVSVTNVLGVCVSDTPGAFAKATRAIADAGITLEYAYAFITPEKGSAFVILRVGDKEKAAAVLGEAGIRIISQKDIFA